MTRKQHAKAMDLPDYPCPPNVAGVAAHAGTWGWANPGGLVVQDPDGHLWVKSDASLSPARDTSLYVLATWTEDGVGLYVPKRTYGWIHAHTAPCAPDWTPVAVVLKDPPAYSLDFNAA